jgi:hypothetical protein
LYYTASLSPYFEGFLPDPSALLLLKKGQYETGKNWTGMFYYYEKPTNNRNTVTKAETYLSLY